MSCSAYLLYVEEYSSANNVGYGVLLYSEGDGSEKEVHSLNCLGEILTRRNDEDSRKNASLS